MLVFELIQRMTQTEDPDLTINLENQTVVVPGTHGRTKRVKRTIYRARFEGKTLIGNLHKRGSDTPWPVYMFNPTRRHWVPREALKLPKDTRTRVTTHLLNAAVMPHAGIYELDKISINAWETEVVNAYNAGTLKHYIGYQTTLNFVEQYCDIKLGGVNVEMTEMWDGDVFLVLRLKRRVAPGEKIRNRRDGEILREDEFEFYRGVYQRKSG